MIGRRSCDRGHAETLAGGDEEKTLDGRRRGGRDEEIVEDGERER